MVPISYHPGCWHYSDINYENIMKHCPKGHQYPEHFLKCPVCAKENEFQTVYGGSPSPSPDNAFHRQSDESRNEIADHQQSRPKAEKSDNLGSTVILGSPLPEGRRLVGWMVELDGKDVPCKSYELFEGKTTIGRHQDNNVTLNDSAVSGSHCFLQYHQDSVTIYDNHSANGVFINDDRVTSQTIGEKDDLLLGRTKLKIKLL